MNTLNPFALAFADTEVMVTWLADPSAEALRVMAPAAVSPVSGAARATSALASLLVSACLLGTVVVGIAAGPAADALATAAALRHA